MHLRPGDDIRAQPAELAARGLSDPPGDGALGHALDGSLDRLSTSQKFRAAYDSDAAGVIKAGEGGRYGYFLQTGEAGPSEAFAEVFAWINGGRPGNDFDLEDWPQTTIFMRELMKELG